MSDGSARQSLDATTSSAKATTAAPPVPVSPAEQAGSEALTLSVFCGLGPNGEFLVMQEGELQPVPALSKVGLFMHDVGCSVVVAHQQGGLPLILGRVQLSAAATASVLKIDAERLLLDARRDIEIRCGEASIVLTRAGKVIIKGEYVLSRSKGANRIKGAYVDIN